MRRCVPDGGPSGCEKSMCLASPRAWHTFCDTRSPQCIRRCVDESRALVPGHVRARRGGHGDVPAVPRCLRTDLRRTDMLVLTAAVSAFLFVYLFTALIRLEWFCEVRDVVTSDL